MKTIAKSDEDQLSLRQRGAEFILVTIMLLLFGFFAYHQFSGTGFMTAGFGPIESVALYGPILVSLAAPVVRALNGSRNSGRPFEIATHLSLMMGSFWLVRIFPFDFSHLGDVMPTVVRLFFSWMTNDIGRLILILQVLLSPLSAVATALIYFSVRRRESAKHAAVPS